MTCCELILDTDDLSEGIDGLFMSSWWEMNWFCGVASALYVAAAAHNHASHDWQLAVFSLSSINGKIYKEGNLVTPVYRKVLFQFVFIKVRMCVIINMSYLIPINCSENSMLVFSMTNLRFVSSLLYSTAVLTSAVRQSHPEDTKYSNMDTVDQDCQISDVESLSTSARRVFKMTPWTLGSLGT